MNTIKQLARERMKGHCRVCPVCDGRACSGEVPGMGGLGTGSSFRANLEALAKVKLAMRCLHGAALPDTSTEVLGLKLSMPVMAAPLGGVAFNMGGAEQNPVDEAMYAEAVIAGSKQAGVIGCGGDGVPPVISGSAFDSIRKAEGWGIPFIKPWEGEEVWAKLEASIATGCPVVGMDVDAAGLVTLRLMGRPVAPTNPAKLAELAKFVHDRGARFMIKGVMTVADAKIAAEAGVDAIVVSNHGGRVLDGTPGGVDVLPAIVEAVGDKIEVLVDGGIRSGTDVLKCLALGAKAVLIGRPLSVAAVGGEAEGVVKYFNQIKGQLTSAMALTGCATVADINSDILA
ncbi:MAG: alpha-hydroxy-acid oxidizing protein [Mailhella sp.]|nr:alpha-hydroxy-acid oxidizing protein [Mailhella sp.]